MSYKLCVQCQFVVPSMSSACTTCGCSQFENCEAPAEHGDEPAVVALRPHVRHVGTSTANRDLRNKITGEQQKLAVGTHRQRILI
jgi:hypothetical protein